MIERKDTIESLKESLTNPSRLISENREAVVVYKDELETLLAYVDVLEAQAKVLPDIVSELSVGDEVMSMIEYMEVQRGTVGKVVAIKPTAEYPIEVQFEGIKFLYLKNGVVGFKRDELGRIKA